MKNKQEELQKEKKKNWGSQWIWMEQHVMWFKSMI